MCGRKKKIDANLLGNNAKISSFFTSQRAHVNDVALALPQSPTTALLLPISSNLSLSTQSNQRPPVERVHVEEAITLWPLPKCRICSESVCRCASSSDAALALLALREEVEFEEIIVNEVGENEDVYEDASEDEYEEPVHKKTKSESYEKKFQPNWLQDKRFKNWMDADSESSVRFRCKACDKRSFKAGVNEALKHMNTQKHKIKMKDMLWTPVYTDSATNLTILKKKKELLMSQFIVKNDLSFQIADELNDLCNTLENLSPSSKGIETKTNLGRTKAASIVKNVLGVQERNKLVTVLKSHLFSIIADESTDITTNKQLAIVVRYTDENVDVHDDFFALIELEKFTAKDIYDRIVALFKKHEIDYIANMIGLGSDNANVMVGEYNSVFSHFQKDIPNLFLSKCVCHTLHLCISHGSSELPEYLEELLRSLSTYFSKSTKRVLQFREYQHMCGMEQEKILYPAKTRWLSLLKCIDRVVKNYIPLKNYFNSESKDPNNKKAQTISEYFCNYTTELYLNFLQYLLPIFHDCNIEMQSENIKIHKLYDELNMIFKSVTCNFATLSHLKNFNDIFCQDFVTQSFQFCQNNNFEGLDLGGVVELKLHTNKTISPEEVNEFKKNCLNCLYKTACEVLNRFNLLNIDFLKQLRILHPSKILNSSLTPLLATCSHIFNEDEINNLYVEFKKIKQYKIEIDDFSKYWKHTLNLKNSNTNYIYPHMRKLFFYISSIPHSSANVERIFSRINLNKTKQRNRLNNETIDSILHAKRLSANCNSYNDVNINKTHYNLFNQNMYKS